MNKIMFVIHHSTFKSSALPNSSISICRNSTVPIRFARYPILVSLGKWPAKTAPLGHDARKLTVALYQDNPEATDHFFNCLENSTQNAPFLLALVVVIVVHVLARSKLWKEIPPFAHPSVTAAVRHSVLEWMTTLFIGHSGRPSPTKRFPIA